MYLRIWQFVPGDNDRQLAKKDGSLADGVGLGRAPLRRAS